MELRGLSTALLLVTICPTALGETVVVPGAEANKSGNMPITVAPTAARIQEICRKRSIRRTCHAITIVALRMRSSPGTGPLNFSGCLLASHAFDHARYTRTRRMAITLPNMTYAANIGPDATVTYRRGLSRRSSPGCAAPGPCPFDIVIPFTTPFSYDPNNGRLLIDLIASALTPASPEASTASHFPTRQAVRWRWSAAIPRSRPAAQHRRTRVWIGDRYSLH